MNNEIPKNQSEEEYHFAPETETPNVYSAEPAVGKQRAAINIFDRIKRKNVLIVGGIIIVVLSVYKLLDVIFTSPPTRTRPVVAAPTFPTASSTTTTTTATSATTPAETPAVPVVTTTTTTSPTNEPVPQNVETRLSAVEAKTDALHDSLTNLESQMVVVQGSLSAINSQLTSLNDSAQSLAAQVAQMQSVTRTAQQTKLRAAVRTRYVPRAIYFVRAMIPGRAWLVTRKGDTLTVSVGDNLPGYGTVAVIDPVKGIITTNVGAIIGYKPNDR